MATITCRCPECERTVRSELTEGQPLDCPLCGHRLSSRVTAMERETEPICLVCPSKELFVRKDFPQRIGVSIVVLGFVASSIAWNYHWVITSFAILFASALIDVILYFVMGNVLECYRCHAQYRGLSNLASEHAFDLEIHERYRQEAARLQQSGHSRTSPPAS